MCYREKLHNSASLVLRDVVWVNPPFTPIEFQNSAILVAGRILQVSVCSPEGRGECIPACNGAGVCIPGVTRGCDQGCVFWIQSKNGRYAFHWNAFLLFKYKTLISQYLLWETLKAAGQIIVSDHTCWAAFHGDDYVTGIFQWPG